MLIYYPFYNHWTLKNFLLRMHRLSLSPGVLVKPHLAPCSLALLTGFGSGVWRWENARGWKWGLLTPTEENMGPPCPLTAPHDGHTLFSTQRERALCQQVTLAGQPPLCTSNGRRRNTWGFYPAKHWEMCPALTPAGACGIFWNNHPHIVTLKRKPKL